MSILRVHDLLNAEHIAGQSSETRYHLGTHPKNLPRFGKADLCVLN